MSADERRQPVSDEELSAFADGQLPPADCARVAAHLRANPQDADRIHSYWTREAELHSAFAVAADDSAPEPVAPVRRPAFPLVYAAAALVLLAVFAAPWLLPVDGGSAKPLPAHGAGPLKQQVISSHAGLDLLPGAELQPRGELQPGGEVQPGGELQPGKELQPGGELQPGQLPAVAAGVTEYRFHDASGTVLVLYEGAPGTGAYPPLKSGAARVEWSAGQRDFMLEGTPGAADLMSLAVGLQERLAPSPAVDQRMGDSPATAPALQLRQEEVSPAGVSKM